VVAHKEKERNNIQLDTLHIPMNK